MTIFIICMVVVVFAMGIVGGIYILGLKDAINEKDSRIKKLESNVEWWQEYCNDITAEKATIINTHENRLKDLEREIDAKNDEILLLENKLLEKDSKPITLEEYCHELGWQAGQEILKEANELREATKDLDFPPVEKEE